MTCPACSSRRIKAGERAGTYTCRRCQGIFGQLYRGDVYAIVRIDRMQADAKPEDLRYFDFDVLGSDGVSRIHGWFDVTTKSVVQFG